MKTKYPSIFGLLAAVLLVLSFVLPASIATPVAADPGICKWDALITPGYLPLKNDVGMPWAGLGYDITDMAVGGDGTTVLLTATFSLPGSYHSYIPCVPLAGTTKGTLFYSPNNGISFTSTKSSALNAKFWDTYGLWAGFCDTTTGVLATSWPNVYSVAIAPDNPNFWAVTTDDWNVGGAALIQKPVEVWITSDGGSSWDKTNLVNTLIRGPKATVPGNETIRTIDISVDYGGKRDVVVGTTDGAGGGELYVVKSTGFTGWICQNVNTLEPLVVGSTQLGAIDFFAVKFSPTYPGDASLAVVCADAGDAQGGTFYNVGLRDIDKNNTNSWAFPVAPPVAGINCAVVGRVSPTNATLNKVDLELPSDFSGQAASLRRAYVSTDSVKPGVALLQDGIFRFDDSTIYSLMDTGTATNKSIYSIAYFGTYASGKLLAGERKGDRCTASVPTWFTDSPTTCPIPCWYPALKPTTGASDNFSFCLTGGFGDGGAVVGWKADGQLAFVGTGSNIVNTVATWYNEWASQATVLNDESAFGISRNNGETWNQIALIDTSIYQLTDVAPTPDCKTVYLASVNKSSTSCQFDSVWRSSSNNDVTAPYPPLVVGTFWERVLTHKTALKCGDNQTNIALLRVVPYCADPTGEIVAWAAMGTKAQLWSPDFGDYWATITPRDPIQDFCFESKTVLYNLSSQGKVQKLPYTGTSWSTTLPSVDTILYSAHAIAAFPEGKVLVGAAAAYHAGLYAASYCGNFNTDNPTFAVMAMGGRTGFTGDVHPAFSPNFNDDNTVFINDKGALGGSVYRNNANAQLRWADTDMMAATNGAVGCFAPHQLPQYGLALGFTGGALYSAHSFVSTTDNLSGVCRTIPADATGNYGPMSGMPKPGVAWDCLRTFVSPPGLVAAAYGLGYIPGVSFTLEPTSLKSCGCCTLDTDTTLYAIDNAPGIPAFGGIQYYPGFRMGLLWAFTDCMAKRGPALITEDKTLIGCDPVSGRAQEVNLCWEQLCVASAYDIEIAKSADFTIKIIDWASEGCSPSALTLITCGACSFLNPADVTQPCVYFPAGGEAYTLGSAIAAYGNLECGHTYYWRVKARACATGQIIRSPWSEVRSFTVKAGLPVVSTYLGLTLLAPNNGCLGCPVQPVSFSWSPFKETTKYKFVLASDAAMTQIVQEAETATTAFEYTGALDYSTNYFWRVMSEEPAPSDWSATFSFQTEAKPAAAAEKAPVAPTPIWVWVVIAIGAILVIVTLVLIFKTRRV